MSEMQVNSHICLHCRTLLPASVECSCGKAQLVRLHGLEGREALIEHVWGPPSRRRSVNRTAAAFALVGGLIFVISLLAVNLTGIGIGLATLFVAGSVRLLGVGGDEEMLRIGGYAAGGAPGPALLPSPSPFSGRVAGDAMVWAPLSQRVCVAFAIQLHGRNNDDVYLREAATSGFTIESNDGRVVRVPPGPILIGGGTSIAVESEESLRAYLLSRDPAWRPDRYDPFPYETGYEAILCVGQEVALHNELAPIHGAQMPVAGYRDSATRLLAPVGTPHIVMLSHPVGAILTR